MGDRFKRYEASTQLLLPRRTYTIIRVDGKAFHTTLRGAKKPYDEGVAYTMDEVAKYMAEEIQGAVFAYTQSDEISLLLQDFNTIDTGAWFDGNVQKMTSISASLATIMFERVQGGGALFDSRVFTISDPVEVANYFIWRQRDAVRNSILATAQAHFGSKRIQGINTSDLVHMLDDKGVHWAEMPGRFTHGALVQREVYVVKTPDGPVLRSRWVARPVEDAWTVNYLMPLIPLLYHPLQDPEVSHDEPITFVGTEAAGLRIAGLAKRWHDTEGEDEQTHPSPTQSDPGTDTERSKPTQDRSN